VIVPDVNLLVYAYNEDVPQHVRAKAWWEDALSSDERVGMPWTVALSFLRLCTGRRILRFPMTHCDALDHIESWLSRPNVVVIEPGPNHLQHVRRFLDEAGVAGALTSDVHLAALALEHNAALHSSDADFSRFSGLRWVNPLRT
jgi:hypothetical protein